MSDLGPTTDPTARAK